MLSPYCPKNNKQQLPENQTGILNNEVINENKIMTNKTETNARHLYSLKEMNTRMI